MVNRDGDEELEGTTTLPYEILNGWCSKEINMTDRSESESSDRTTTWNYGRKERVEKNHFILEEVVGAMKPNSSLTRNESVCSSGVEFDEGNKVGSHIKQLGSARKEEYTNLKDKVSKLDRGQCSSTPTLEISPASTAKTTSLLSDGTKTPEHRRRYTLPPGVTFFSSCSATDATFSYRLSFLLQRVSVTSLLHIVFYLTGFAGCAFELNSRARTSCV
ncbi:hypothetical protein PIB30_006860 [Stylosanthes scabra]|uniref:Uncharacterized protein n=1 Tax=Stylosanthes scabra TaxID=79078 RepID=A0ABU6V3T4_9FABA|nr:hypothetical protein [Stylosanthes scabra]